MQDMCRFFGFSLLLQVLLFVVGLSGGWHHAQSTTEVVQRALDTVIAAIPVGKVTFMTGTLTGSVVRPNSLHLCCYKQPERQPDRHRMATAGA